MKGKQCLIATKINCCQFKIGNTENCVRGWDKNLKDKENYEVDDIGITLQADHVDYWLATIASKDPNTAVDQKMVTISS